MRELQEMFKYETSKKKKKRGGKELKN